MHFGKYMLIDLAFIVYDGTLLNIILVALSLRLNSFNIKKHLYEVLSTGTLIGFFSIFTYNSPQIIRVILNILITFTLIRLIFGFKTVRSLLVTLTIQALGILIVGIPSFILIYFFKITFYDYWNSLPLRLWFSLTYVIPAIIINYTAYRKGWCIFSGSPCLKPPIVLIAPIIVQFTILIIIMEELAFKEGRSLDTFKLDGIISIILLFSFFFSILFLWRIFRSAEKEAAISSQIEIAAKMKQHNDVIRSQRHDFVNHLQIINALFQNGQMQALAQYVAEIKQEII